MEGLRLQPTPRRPLPLMLNIDSAQKHRFGKFAQRIGETRAIGETVESLVHAPCQQNTSLSRSSVTPAALRHERT